MAAYEFETGLAHEYEDEVYIGPAAAAARAAMAAVAGEMEGESEYEAELNPVRRWYPDAMLEHLAHEATEAESESEAAEAFLPLIPLVASKLLPLAAKAAPMIAKALPKVMNVVSRVTPHLTRGVANVARRLFRTPATRQLLRTIPTIAQRTVGQIARQVAVGRPVTPRTAVRTLARQTAAVIRRPAHVRRAIIRSAVLDRRLHRAIPTGTFRPGGCPPCPPCPCARAMAPAPFVPGTVPVAAVPRVAPRPRSRGCGCCGCGCRADREAESDGPTWPGPIPPWIKSCPPDYRCTTVRPPDGPAYCLNSGNCKSGCRMDPLGAWCCCDDPIGN
jgi:hypothetical protein